MILNKSYFIFCYVTMCALSGFAQTYPGNDPHYGAYKWKDDFRTKSLPYLSSVWWTGHNDDHGGEPQVYLNANVTINTTEGVVLTQKPETGVTCTPCKWSPHYYSSGLIHMYPDVSPTGTRYTQYGYIEATIQVPNNYGLFPALWLWSCNSPNNHYNEIDVFEVIPGNTQSNTTQPLYGTIHNQNTLTSNRGCDISQTLNCKGPDTDPQINPIPAS